MALTTKTLLPLTTYGVPSGNYNGTSLDFIGDTVPGASYYTVKHGSNQTAVITTTNFIGVITLQASLGTVAEQDAWFDVATYGNSTTPTTGTTAADVVQSVATVAYLDPLTTVRACASLSLFTSATELITSAVIVDSGCFLRLGTRLPIIPNVTLVAVAASSDLYMISIYSSLPCPVLPV